MATKTLMQRLSGRPAKALPSPAPTPVDLATEIVEGGGVDPVSPLQTLANAIQRAAADLRQLDDIRQRLEGLRGPVETEFENRVMDNNRLAQLASELQTARTRLAETDIALQRSNERNRELDRRIGALGDELERTQVSLKASSDALERLRPEHKEATAQLEEQRAHILAYSGEVFDLRTDKEYLSRRLAEAEAERAAGEAALARAREDGAQAQARAEGALKRLELAAAANLELERGAGALKAAMGGEQERAAELASRLAAARAEARHAAEAMNGQLETSREETDGLRSRLEESLACTGRMQALHAELAAGQGALLEEKARLQSEVASLGAETRQMAQRIEILDSLSADWKRRFAEADAARAAAAAGMEALQLALAQSEAALRRAEALGQQRGEDLESSAQAHDEQQQRLRAEVGELKGDLSQARAELRMVRASLAAKA